MAGTARRGGNEATDEATDEAPGDGTREAARVRRRLERIEALDRERAPAGRLLGELRALVGEAEAWARAGAQQRSRERLGKVGEEAEGMR